MSKDELADKSGLPSQQGKSDQPPLLVQLLRQARDAEKGAAAASQAKPAAEKLGGDASEESKKGGASSTQ